MPGIEYYSKLVIDGNWAEAEKFTSDEKPITGGGSSFKLVRQKQQHLLFRGKTYNIGDPKIEAVFEGFKLHQSKKNTKFNVDEYSKTLREECIGTITYSIKSINFHQPSDGVYPANHYFPLSAANNFFSI